MGPRKKGQSHDTTTAIVDGLVRFVAGGGVLATALLAPNAVQALDKPLQKLFEHLDKRARDRELRRVVYYMKNRGLIDYEPRDYEHGIALTDKGKQRLEQLEYAHITIPRPVAWDHKWRLVFFDIPELHKGNRNALDRKLALVGFKQLQMSIWVHPFPARAEIEAICESLAVRPYVTYVEVSHIDNATALQRRFKHLLNTH